MLGRSLVFAVLAIVTLNSEHLLAELPYGKTQFIFGNDYMIVGGSRQVVPGVKANNGNPVVTPEYNWEIGSDRANPNDPRCGQPANRIYAPSLTVDADGKLRMFYVGLDRAQDDPADPTDAGRQVVCTAESIDGLTWTKTMSDHYTYNGQNTNVVLRGQDFGIYEGETYHYTDICSLSPMKTPATHREGNRAYIGFVRAAGAAHGRQLMMVSSDDGIHWVPDADCVSMAMNQANSDAPISVAYCPDNKFRAYYRDFWPNTGYGGLRVVQTASTADLDQPLAFEGTIPLSSTVQSYTNQSYGYGVTDVEGTFVSLTPILHTIDSLNGYMDCTLDTSRTGLVNDWERLGRTTIPRGPGSQPEDSFDWGMTYFNSGIVEYNGKWLCAYSGSDREHNNYSMTSIGMIQWDRGRLVEVTQNDPETVAYVRNVDPMPTNDSALYINCASAGDIDVAVYNAAWNLLPDFDPALTVLTPVAGDPNWYRVTWDGMSAHLPYSGEYYLVFALSDGATLYSYTMVPEPGPLVMLTCGLIVVGWNWKRAHRHRTPR